MMTLKRVIGVSVLTLLAFLSFQNCGKVDFVDQSSLASSGTTVTSTSCTLRDATEPVNLKIFFMVDNSGSTLTTDPNKFYRIKAVQNLMNQYGSVPTFQYGYGYFSVASSLAFDFVSGKFIDSLTAQMTPFGNVSSLATALTAYTSVSAGGNTPYSAAFNGIQNAINTDIARSAAAGTTKWAYAIVFMSDGQPTDLSGDIQKSISNLVKQLQTNIKNSGSLSTVSSVYFGPESDSTSISNLKLMATEGQGQFIDTNITTDFNFDSVITVPGTSCH